MAGREASESDIVYDPVRLHPDASLFNRIDLENILDKDNYYRPGINPETGRPFQVYDIHPQAELRMQMRQRVVVKDEYFAGQNISLRWTVIQDYPFEISDEIHMSDYLNSVDRWISTVISLPRDSKAVWKTLNLLRLNCQYSDANKTLFRSVNGFVTLIEALSKHFSLFGLRGATDNVDDEETRNICREILKLAEITGFSAENAVSITDSRYRAEGFCGILRTVYFLGCYVKDKARIVRITHTMFNNPRLDHLDNFFHVIYFILIDPNTPSVDLILCADIAYAFSNEEFQLTVVTALYGTLKFLVDRFYDSDETNSNRVRVRGRVDEEYNDRSAALEKVLKILCQLCAKYGSQVVSILMKPGENPAVHRANLILKHALLHTEAGEASFRGKHLLYAMFINKYIFESTAGQGVSPEDIKVVFDFALSDLPSRYLFNGRRRLKDLTDQVVDNLLNCEPSLNVLRYWTDFPL